MANGDNKNGPTWKLHRVPNQLRLMQPWPSSRFQQTALFRIFPAPCGLEPACGDGKQPRF